MRGDNGVSGNREVLSSNGRGDNEVSDDREVAVRVD